MDHIEFLSNFYQQEQNKPAANHLNWLKTLILWNTNPNKVLHQQLSNNYKQLEIYRKEVEFLRSDWLKQYTSTDLCLKINKLFLDFEKENFFEKKNFDFEKKF